MSKFFGHCDSSSAINKCNYFNNMVEIQIGLADYHSYTILFAVFFIKANSYFVYILSFSLFIVFWDYVYLLILLP